jgi:hypothetical protein
MQSEAILASDEAVAARYLQLRTIIHDRHLARVERLVLERYDVELVRTRHSSFVCSLRTGFLRPGEGEVWPAVLLTMTEISVALFFEVDAERMAAMGTVLRGPHRVRHRGWEECWGWENTLADVHAHIFDLTAPDQEEALATWFTGNFEWLAHAGLLKRKAATPSETKKE